jgi:hypothetical protein
MPPFFSSRLLGKEPPNRRAPIGRPRRLGDQARLSRRARARGRGARGARAGRADREPREGVGVGWLEGLGFFLSFPFSSFS